MSFIGGLFGDNGTNFQAQSGNVVSTTGGGAQGAIDQSQNSIAQQQALATALAQQGGIQNQSNIYNQLGGVASGQGPNPAQAMLAQATAQNVAQQAAQQAGQRGASQNVGLIARQAGQTGGAIQQQAAGQGATMQAQQSLNALGQQAGIAGQQVGNQLNAQQALTGAAQNQAGQLIGANVAQNTANIQNAQQQNASNAAIAGINAQGQQQLIGQLAGSGAQSAMSMAHGGIAHQAGVSPYAKHLDDGGIAEFGNSDISPTPTSSFGKAMISPDKSSGGGGGGILKLAALLSKGGRVGYASGAQVPNTFTPFTYASGSTPQANPWGGLATNLGTGIGKAIHSLFTPAAPTPGGEQSDYTSLPDAPAMAKGGVVPAMVSPGEKIIPPSEINNVADGKKSPLSAGKTVAGKAKVAGDNVKNDTVPKDLAEGSIVLPRSVVQSATPGHDARKFVEALLQKQGKKKKVTA